jgi:hypothetical protein
MSKEFKCSIMTSDHVPAKSPLLPVRHPEYDFFICDIFNASPKADIASMEHPIFSLSTKPDHRIRHYEHNGAYIDIKPSANGLATIHDRDILIYCISQLMAAMNENRPISQVIRFKAIELLQATNRMTTGRGYELLKAALERLRGTSISTNIITGSKEQFEVFGLIESAKVVRETRDGRMQEIEVKLSDWVFNAIRANEVLTLNRNYFRLRKPLERRLYELARKHCGKQLEWRVTLDLLRKKCGSNSSIKEFRRLVQEIVEEDKLHNHIPDYSIFLNENDMVIFQSRWTAPAVKQESDSGKLIGHLHPETYHDARTVAPGWDVYELERSWRDWFSMSGSEPPRDPDAAFLGFCRAWQQKRGSPK